MRNVMVGCFLPVLFCGLSQLVSIFAQDHRYIWSEQQTASDEWHPFVPTNYESQNRHQQNFPQPETRQYFGKAGEPVQNPALKKSFQATAAANNVDQFSFPPAPGTFSSFNIQSSLQARNPLFDKNIKDGHLLEQPSHFQLKYHPQQQQAQLTSSVHRFPPYLSSASVEHYRQPLPSQQPSFQVNPAHPYSNRPPLLQSTIPRTPIATSIQVFPPQASSSQYGQFPNNYFLGLPPKEQYVNEEEPPQDRKHLRSSVNVYNTREGVQPVTQKNIQYNIQRPEHNFYYDNVKAPPGQYEYVVSDMHRGIAQQSIPAFPNSYGNEHNRGTNRGVGVNLKLNAENKKPEEANPSKQVFEQLSHLGRPFSLSKDTNFEETETESLSSFSSIPQQHQTPSNYKKTKPIKQPTTPSIVYHRIPGNLPHNIIDYETGSLQSVKTVTYLPQQDFIQFNEQDASKNLYQSTSQKPLSNKFLPTPTNSNEDNIMDITKGSGITYTYHDRFPGRTTVSPYDGISKLPHNHKYSSTNIRNRQPESESFPTEESKVVDNFNSDKVSNEDLTTTTTKKSNLRRRKPSKSKSKIPNSNRYTTTPPQDKDYSNTEEYINTRLQGDSNQGSSNYYKAEGNNFDNSKDENVNKPIDTSFIETEKPTIPTTTPIHIIKKKQKLKSTTAATSISSDDNYPNYPLKYNYQSQNKQFGTHPSSNYDDQHNNEDKQNYELEDMREDDKANYPSLRPKFKPLIFSITTPVESIPQTTLSTVPKIHKSKFTTPASAVSSSSISSVTRPRFSIKDYRHTSTVAPTTISSINAVNEAIAEAEIKKNRKQLFALRSRNRTEQAVPENDNTATIATDDTANQKYKQRVRPSRYKTSPLTTSTVSVDTTTERVNTFKPSGGGRLKTITSKYYNRYRTTTEINNAAAAAENESESDKHQHDVTDDVAVASSNNKPTHAVLFSAKKPSINTQSKSIEKSTLVPKVITEYEEDRDEDYEEDDTSDDDITFNNTRDEKLYKKAGLQIHLDTKNKTMSYKHSALPSQIKKADNISDIQIMTSLEEESEIDQNATIVHLDDDNDDDGDTDFSSYSFEDLPVSNDFNLSEQKNNSSKATPSNLSLRLLASSSTPKSPTSTLESMPIVQPTTKSQHNLQEGKESNILLEEKLHTNKKDQQDYQDDINDQVSKVSSLTSQDDSNYVNGMAANTAKYKNWRYPLYPSRHVVTAIKTTSDY